MAFSDQATTLYKEGDSFFHRLDPRTKMFILLPLFCYLYFSIDNPTFPLIIWVVVFAANVWATGTYAFKNPFTKVIVMICTSVILMQALVNPPAKRIGHIAHVQAIIPFNLPKVFQLWIFNLPFIFTEGFYLPFYFDGIYFGLTFATRIAAISYLAFLLVSTTHPSDLVESLVRIGVPFDIGFALMLSIQLIPVFEREAAIILQAQQARGLSLKSIPDRVRAIFPIFVPLAVNSIERVQIMSMSLESRAYGAPVQRTPLRDVSMKKKDWTFIVLGVIWLILVPYFTFFTGLYEIGDRWNWFGSVTSWDRIFLPPVNPP